MNRFYVVTNESKDVSLHITKRVRDYIVQRQGACALAAEGMPMPRDTDCILVLGGDGTLIRAAREFHSCGVPLLGINMGTLGYLTEVEVQNVETAIDQLMTDSPVVEERMMLRGTMGDGTADIALNDIVLTRQGCPRVIDFDLYVNSRLLHSYQADGIILSTPTGSTAYNLSAGGPIVEPTAAMIVITPICSHALNTSSIVLSAEDEIILEVGRGRNGETEEAGISFDGGRLLSIRTGERITIRRAKETAKLLKVSKESFLETLRKKMKGN